MNDELIRKFCESSRRGLIVTIVTILLGLVVLTPLVDDYFDNRESCDALTGEIELARSEAELLPQLEQRAGEVASQLELQEQRCVSEKNLSEYRSRLVELVRDSGCQIRRLELTSPISRQWKAGDNPLEDGISTATTGEETPFFVEHRNVQLSVNGRSAGIYQLLEKIQNDVTLAFPEKLEIHSDGQNGEELTLDLDLWLFALNRQSS